MRPGYLFSCDDKARIAELWREGYGAGRIAQILKINSVAIARFLKQNGFSRTRTEQEIMKRSGNWVAKKNYIDRARN